MTRLFFPIIGAVLALCIGCGQSPKEVVDTAVEEVQEVLPEAVEAETPTPEAEPAPEAESVTVTVTGKLVDIYDGPYPQFVVTVDDTEGSADAPAKIEMNLNIEAMPTTIEELYALENKAVRVTYMAQAENRIQQMYHNDVMAGGDKAIDTPESSFTGVLSGAETPTVSDLPGTLTVTSSDGTTMRFPQYIEDAEVALNGKVVTIEYYVRSINTAINLEAADE